MGSEDHLKDEYLYLAMGNDAWCGKFGFELLMWLCSKLGNKKHYRMVLDGFHAKIKFL